MLVSLVATLPACFASLALWAGNRRCPAKLDRIEAMLETVVDWQFDHERAHRAGGKP